MLGESLIMLHNKKTSNKIIPYMLLCTLMLCTMLVIVGCGGTKKEDYAKIEKKAKTNAVKYISDKYGFEAEVISAEAEPNYGAIFGWDDTSTGYAMVTLQHDNKQFQVVISGEDNSTNGKDNYQQSIIEEAIKQEFISAANINADEVHCDIFYEYHFSYETDTSLILTNVYYDGNNIYDVLKDISGDTRFRINYKLVTLNASLKGQLDASLKSIVNRDEDALIANCDNKDDFEVMKEATFEAFNIELYKYIIYMTDYALIDNGSLSYTDINKMAGQGFTICYTGGSYCEATPADWIFDETNNSKQVFGAYKFDSDADNLYLFVELDKLDAQEYDGSYIANTFLNQNGRYYNRSSANDFVNDEYLVYKTSIGTQTTAHIFTVLK